MTNYQRYEGFGYAKTLIFGEYAVMYSAFGLIMAMPQKLRLQLEITPTPYPSDSPFARILQQQLTGYFHLTGNIALDDAEFFDAHHIKYGIGSSAAGVVALCKAAAQASMGSRAFSLSDAITIHRSLQNGMGSGIDIHASALGGVLSVQGCPNAPEYRNIPLENLPALCVLAGHQQSTTTDYLIAAKKAESTRDYQKTIESLADHFCTLTQYAESGDKNNFLELIAKIPALLKTLERILDRQILPNDFEDWAALAREHRVTLKTSGAGGGDILIAMAENAAQLHEYLRHLPSPLSPLNSDVPAFVAPPLPSHT